MKNNRENRIGWGKVCRWAGIWIRLSLFTLFILTEPLVVEAAGQSVTLRLENVSLKEAFKEIKRQLGYRLAYNEQVINAIGNVSVDVVSGNINEVMEQCLRGSDFSYEIENQIIVIYKKQAGADMAAPQKLIKLEGVVVDSKGGVLPGVTVVVKGTTIGVATDIDGKFSLEITETPGISLEFSFVGMNSKEIPVKIENGKVQPLRVVLEEAETELDEVVVTGMFSRKKEGFTGSAVTVKGDELKKISTTSIAKALSTIEPSFRIMENISAGSDPNRLPDMRMRGSSTLPAGGAGDNSLVSLQGEYDTYPNQPLLILDGFEIDVQTMVDLDPDRVQSITMLKDASATAIYGSKASNGVIEITTKKNTTDRLSVNYTSNFIIGTRPNYDQFNYMNSKERVLFSQEAFNWGTPYSAEPIKQMYTYEGLLNMYLSHDISSEEFLAQRNVLETQNTDWFKLLTRRAFSHNHNLSVSGGTNKYSYSASMGYSKSEGQEIGNDSERMTGRLAITIRPVQKLTINAAINGSVNTNKGFAGGVNPLGYATTTNRSIDPDVYYQMKASYPYNEGVRSLSYNFINERENSGSKSASSYLSASLDLKWNILDWLTYQFTGGYSDNNSTNEAWESERTFYIAENYRGYDFNSVSPASKEFKAALLPFGGELFTNNTHQYSYNIQNKLQFSKAFNDENRLNALVGMELRSTTNKGINNTVWGYVPDRGEVITSPTTLQAFEPITGSQNSGWGILQRIYDGGWRKVNTTDNFFSVFATLAYSFKNRYVINANVRNDASNRFGQDTNHRIDPTYSFGFSWRASEERFMRKYVGWITNLNFRGTYGIQGNALTRLSPDLILNQGTVADLYNRYQSTISQIPNPTLSWERTKSWNFGIDLELFNLFNMNLEYYTRRSNAIVELDLPYEYGISSMKRNGGIIHNRGIEYTLTFTPIQKRDYALSVSLNASKNWNEGGHTDIEVKASDFLNGRSDIILKQGYPLSSFWSYSFAGLNGQTGEPQFNLLDIPDDQRSRLIDPTTYLVYSGQRDPYFTGGLSLSFRYKSLTLNSSFSLLLGNKKRLPSPYSQFSSSYYMPDPYTNINRDLLNRWKEPGDEAHTIIPSLPKGNMSLIQLPNGESTFKIPVWEQSDAMVVSGSFLRCRNIGLSWQMKREWCEKIYMKNLSLNFNMDNIFVIASKRFNGFDPEISNSVLPRNYSLGINIGF